MRLPLAAGDERGMNAGNMRLLLGASVEWTAGVDDMRLGAGNTCRKIWPRKSTNACTCRVLLPKLNLAFKS